jgi:hypothetical protein
MFFLLSGEGVTDMGAGKTDAPVCEGADFFVGPMAMIVAQVVESQHNYSILDGACGFVSENGLTHRAGELKAVKKALRLPGKKQAKETRYFFNNARILSRMAKEKAAAITDEVVAVLFRDADGTASAGRGLWEEKRQSMLDGFEEEGFDKGVPMLPKPKSEAWLICALKKRPYQDCNDLEDRSGNDKSPKSLKKELAKLLGEEVTPELLCDKVQARVTRTKNERPEPNHDGPRTTLQRGRPADRLLERSRRRVPDDRVDARNRGRDHVEAR